MQGLARPTPEPASPGKPVAGGGHGIIITPADVRKLFLKRKWIILAAMLIGVGISIYHIETAIPEYEAIASVDVNLNRTSNIGFANLVSNGNTEDWSGSQLDTQLRIMQSDSVAKRVIRSLQLYEKRPFSAVFGKAGCLNYNNERLTLMQTLPLAGGSMVTSKMKDVRLIQKTRVGEEEIKLSLKKIYRGKEADITVADGDILYVPSSNIKTFIYQGYTGLISSANAAVWETHFSQISKDYRSL